jgi:ankyrin repeat protein
MAAEEGREGVVGALLRASASLERSVGRWRMGAAMCAAENGHVGVVRLLLSQQRSVLSEVDERARTLLMHACECRNDELISFLLKEHGARAVINQHDHEGNTALMIACEHSASTNSVQELLRHGALVNGVAQAAAHESTALHRACEFGHAALVQLLLREKASVDAPRADGSTALFVRRPRPCPRSLIEPHRQTHLG